jgi:hypothetical protein
MKLKIASIQQKIKDIIPILLLYSPSSFLLLNGCLNYQAAADFNHKALPSVGIIIETEARQKTFTSGYSAFTETYYVSTIQFETKEGKITRFEESGICQANPLNLCDGRKVQVLYAADNPELSMVEGWTTPLDRVINNIIIGTYVTLGLSLWLLWLIHLSKNNNK